MNDKIDINEVNKIPLYTLEGRTVDLSKNKITVEELIKWINNLEWQGYER